jgi:hypothetical protein
MSFIGSTDNASFGRRTVVDSISSLLLACCPA